MNNELFYSKLLDEYSLIPNNDNIWVSYTNENYDKLPIKGFKIHFSTTPLDLNNSAEVLIPFLVKKRIIFKCVKSHKILNELNFAKYGFSQIGKAFTIYPLSEVDFLEIVEELKKITSQYNGPFIPSDNKIPDSNCLYYRYGTMRYKKDKEGQEVIDDDERNPDKTIPEGVKDPFALYHKFDSSLFPKEIIFIDILRQRPKGGVYSGIYIDKKNKLINKVIIKEGRFLGERESLLTDARRRLKWQYEILLKTAESIYTPKVFSFFELDNNFYLVMEYLDAEPLSALISSEQKYFSSEQANNLIINIKKMIKYFHNKNIYICDISLDNILIKNSNCFIADLETCYNSKFPIFNNYGTENFFQKKDKIEILTEKDAIERDLYALHFINEIILKKVRKDI